MFPVLAYTLLAASFATSQSTSVQIKSGTVNGGTCLATPAKYYFGIPFAQPPVNALRFKPPVAYSGTYPDGAVNATTEPSSCIQFFGAFKAPGLTSEDCLYLNVYTPPDASSKSNLPVKFWIYGGYFAAGGVSDSLYNGCNIASDAIIVEVNYRVGPLGWLYAPDAGIDGNMGLLDQVAGLEWVQENIAAFGGNPKKVEVFGQSAGAISAWVLSTLPQAPILMAAVVGESGAGSLIQTDVQARNLTARFAANLGCNTNDNACFVNAANDKLLSATPAYAATEIASARLRWSPVIDGKTVPADPNTVGSKVPLVAGTTSEEGVLFALLQDPNPTQYQANNYSDYLIQTFGNLASAVNASYPLSLFNSTPFPALYAISQIVTDFGFFCPSRRALQSTVAAGQSAYAYQWFHAPSCDWDSFGKSLSAQEAALIASIFGATHTSEIPFVFNVTTNLPAPNGTCNFNNQELQLVDFVVKSWTNMAENQNPGAGWPKWDVSSSQGLLVNNATSFGAINFAKCAFVDEVTEAVVNGSANANLGQGSGAATSSSSGSGGVSATSTNGGASPSQTAAAGMLKGDLNVVYVLSLILFLVVFLE